MGEAALKKKAFALVSPAGESVSAGPRRSHPVTRDGTALPFFPVGTRLCIERLPPDAEVSGIIIPDNAQVQQQYGTLIAAGPQAQGILDDMGIDIGDTICFGKHAGLNWEWTAPGEGPAYNRRRRVEIIRAEDILGGKELAEKMIDGRLGVALYCRDCQGVLDPDRHNVNHRSTPEYRFFAEAGSK